MRRIGRHLGIAATLWCATLHAQETAVFEGKVVDSVTGTGIAKAAIHLGDSKADRSGYNLRSGMDGRFRFESIAPGDYHVEISARGYVDSVDAISRLAPGQTLSGASIPLEPEAVVSGRVADSQGDALPRVVVRALQQTWQVGRRAFTIIVSTEADDRGEYRLTLKPGRYYFSAEPTQSAAVFTTDEGKPEMRIRPTYYPDASTLSAAAEVTLQAGRSMIGVDFRLPTVPSYHVRGVLASFANVNPQAPKYVYLRTRDGEQKGTVAGAAVEKDGSFDCMGVPAGRYWLELPRMTGMPTSVMFPIDVFDRDVNDVKLPAIPPFTLRGHVRIEGSDATAPLSSVKLRLQELETMMFDVGFSLPRDGQGSFEVQNILCGEYSLRLTSEGDYFVKSVYAQGRLVENGIIDLRSGAAGDLDVILGTGTGEVAGMIQLPESVQVLAARHAILVSADGPTSNTLARSVEVDAAGSYRFRHVPPGRWLVFVAPAFDEGLWQNAEFVKQIAAGVTAFELKKGQVAQAQTGPLRAEDIQRAIDRILQ